MKLHTTPQSILTLVTWVPQSRLTFGPRQTKSYSVQSPARCLIVRPYADSPESSYSNDVVNISSSKDKLYSIYLFFSSR